MGFNYRQKRKEFEQNWAKALKQLDGRVPIG